MSRWGLIIVLGLSLALGVAAWRWQVKSEGLAAELLAAQAALATANLQLDQLAEAAAVHRAYITQMEDEARRWTALENDLLTMEGADAPLSDYLRGAAGKLWP
jgi:hypothetical protein